MRNYFDEVLPPYRTPRVHNAIHRVSETDSKMISMWVCSKGDSMDRSKWYFAVQVNYTGGPNDGKTETHFFLDERDAWLYRGKQLGCPRVQIIAEYQHVQRGNVLHVEGTIIEPDFSERSLWDGYLLSEVENLID